MDGGRTGVDTQGQLQIPTCRCPDANFRSPFKPLDQASVDHQTMCTGPFHVGMLALARLLRPRYLPKYLGTLLEKRH